MNAVYFDLDGTLIDYEISFEALYNTTLRELDVEPSGKAAFSEALFDVLEEADDPFATAITRTEVDVNPTAFSDALVRAEIEHIHEKTGVRSLLHVLDERYSLGILTNGVGCVQRAKLDAVGLTDWFDAIVIRVKSERKSQIQGSSVLRKTFSQQTTTCSLLIRWIEMFGRQSSMGGTASSLETRALLM